MNITFNLFNKLDIYKVERYFQILLMFMMNTHTVLSELENAIKKHKMSHSSQHSM
jgi:endonuclease V-like protein UPF0215 family